MLNHRRSLPLLAACAVAAAWAFTGLAWAQAQAPVAQQRSRPAPPTAPAPERMTVPVFPTAPCGRVDIAPVVQVSVGKSTVIKPTTPVARILLGNPDGSRAARPTVATSKEKNEKDDKGGSGSNDDKSRPGVADIDVLLLSPTEVYLLGRSIGSTNVVLLDKAGTCTAFDVVVNMDTNALQTIIGQLMPEEKNVRVSSAFDSIVLSGSVTDPGAVTRVTDLAKAYVRPTGAGPLTGMNPRVVNMLSVGSPQQVMLEVKVAEISKSVLDKFGINFTRALITGQGLRMLSGLFGGVGAVAGAVGGLTPQAAIDGTISGSTGGNGQASGQFAGPVQYGPNGNIIPSLGKSSTQINVDAQKTDGLVKILAEPTVMAISGKKGSFLAGGKIFIPVSQDSGANGTKVTLEEKEFGVSVAFLPTVLDGGRVDLEVATEVSELNREGIGISAPGISGLAVLPSFTSRRAKTTVQLQDGQSFAIGGLIKNNTTTNIRAFPILGELPILGALFRSTEFQTDRSELVFIITPRLVKPLPPDFALPTDNYTPPTRKELIVDGKLEGANTEGEAPKPTPANATTSSGFQVK
jgi:pilus assembly protein CpaC